MAGGQHSWQTAIMKHVLSAHMIFHSIRGHLRTQKHQNSWRLGRGWSLAPDSAVGSHSAEKA